MKLLRSFLATKLIFALVSISFLSLLTPTISAQDSKTALQRGYRTGYSDGYMSGYRDVIENATKSYDKHREYTKADRAFSESYGNLEDYRDGYQQGFESGYNTGFEKRSFDATLPEGLTKRGTVSAKTGNNPKTKMPKPPVITKKQPKTELEAEPVATNSNEKIVIIPAETEIVVELLGDINTNTTKEGDRFQAKVVSPYEINGALIEGRVTKIQKPGRVKKRAELQFSFDQIRLSDVRWANYNATLMEVLPIKDDNVKLVDNEGTVKGRGTLKSDGVKVGATTGTGLVIGAVVGGPVGAAVGAGVGAAFGLGGVLVERGKHIKLTKGQQLRVKTAYETQIR